MELQKIIDTRQSIRRYKEGDIPEADIRQMIAAAGKAPSGKNSQNWHFVAIKSQSVKEKIGAVVDKKNEFIAEKMKAVDPEKALGFRKLCKNYTLFFVNAPVLIVVYTTSYAPSGYNEMKLYDADEADLSYIIEHLNPGMQSLGAAMENLVLKAVDLGYGSCWLTSANYAAHEIEALLKEAAGFSKEGYFMAAMLAMGVPEDNQKSPKKKDVEEIYTMIE